MNREVYLSEDHLKTLITESAISEEVIAERGYRTVESVADLPPIFSQKQEETIPGLLIPITAPSGSIATYQFKPDNPRLIDGKPVKYETAANGRMSIDVPLRSRLYLNSVDEPLFITEGIKKADSAVANNMRAVVALLGVDAWTSFGVALPDWIDIRIKGRVIIIAFDSDVMQKRSVRRALAKLAKWLAYRGARVRYLIMPSLPDGGKCGLDDWFASGRSAGELNHHIVDILPGGTDDWPEPIPFESRTLHRFNIGDLPGMPGEFVAAVAEETQVSTGVVASMALGAISACVGGKYQIADPWEEPVHIQTVQVDSPGSRKSVVHRMVTSDIRNEEQRRAEEDKPRIREWESRARVFESQLKSFESACANPERKTSVAIQDPELQRQSILREIQKHLSEQPHLFRALLDDSTSEHAKQVMAENNGAVAVMSPEPAFFGNLGGRYSEGAPALEVMLQGHAADSMDVGRIGRSGGHIRRACLTICVAMQPDVMRGLGKINGFRSVGAAARLLPEMTPSSIGFRSINVERVSEKLKRAWGQMVTRLLSEAPPRIESEGNLLPCDLGLADDAYEAFHQFRESHEPRMRQSGDLYDIADWASKMPGAILRLAGLLHVATNERPWEVSISLDTLTHAIALGEHYADHAHAMYELMDGRSDVSDVAVVLDALKELPSPATRRMLHQKLRGRSRFQNNPGALDAPLQILEDLGWIRIDRIESEATKADGKKAGGRPSWSIEINPKAHAQNPRNMGSIKNLRDRWPEVSLAPTGSTAEDFEVFS